jgi:hypothetical protein
MHGDDVLRLSRILLDLVTKTSNVIVYGTGQRKIVVTPYLVKQLVARDSLSAMLNKVPKHSEFAW